MNRNSNDESDKAQKVDDGKGDKVWSDEERDSYLNDPGLFFGD